MQPRAKGARVAAGIGGLPPRHRRPDQGHQPWMPMNTHRAAAVPVSLQRRGPGTSAEKGVQSKCPLSGLGGRRKLCCCSRTEPMRRSRRILKQLKHKFVHDVKLRQACFATPASKMCCVKMTTCSPSPSVVVSRIRDGLSLPRL